MYQKMASLGLSSWMSGILVVVWTSRGGLELVHYLGESRMLRMGLLRLVRCRWVVQVKLGLERGKYPTGLHAVEASYVSASSLGAFRAIVRSVWSSIMSLGNTQVVLWCGRAAKPIFLPNQA